MTIGRTRPFWEAIEGRAPMPPAAATPGLVFIAADSGRGTAGFAFTATDAFTNPFGR